MNIKKEMFPLLTVLVMGGVIAFGASQVHAQTTSNTNPYTKLVQVMAQKFNLDQREVQAVVDQYKVDRVKTRQADREQKQTDRLTQLVTDGKITDSQRQAIQTKLESIKGKYSPEVLRNLSVTERKQKRQEMQDELKAFATSQGIDLKYVMPSLGMMGMRSKG